MKLFSVAVLSFAAAAPAVLADTVQYDPTYDNGNQSLSTVACSDGANGLMTKGFSTFSSLPSFPNISATAAVSGWNSTQCGSCWQLSYNGKSANVTAVDHADTGFVVSLETMNILTDGQGKFLGSIDAVVEQLDASQCGF